MSVPVKINAVMADVSNIAKDGKSQQGYNYLSEEAITNALHHACTKHGLVFMPSSMEILDSDNYPVSNNKLMFRARVRVTYTLVDADDPAPAPTMTVQSLGEGADMADKVLNKCMTGAYKYALRQTFMISTGDDPDAVAEPANGPPARRTQVVAKLEVEAATKEYFCTHAGCGVKIEAATIGGKGKAYSAEQIANLTKLQFDGYLCPIHWAEAIKAKKASPPGASEPPANINIREELAKRAAAKEAVA